MTAPSTPTPPGGPPQGPAPLQGPCAGAARETRGAGDAAALRELLEVWRQSRHQDGSEPESRA